MDRKLHLLAAFIVVVTTILNIPFPSWASSDDPRPPPPCLGKAKITTLRFYVQDIVAGPNETVWAVARSELTDHLPSAFGLLSVLDNLVTSGQEMSSGEVGRIQGLIGMSDFKEKAIVMLLNIVFTEGEYKGSGLCVLGRNPLSAKVRELAIVGGTGAFRMANGYVVTRTSYSDGKDMGVYQYDVVVAHRDVGDCVSDV